MDRLEGKRAVVTGAGAGIGRSIALRLAVLDAGIAADIVRERTACRIAIPQLVVEFRVEQIGLVIDADVVDRRLRTRIAQRRAVGVRQILVIAQCLLVRGCSRTRGVGCAHVRFPRVELQPARADVTPPASGCKPSPVAGVAGAPL
jgi:NAD(P)-dependent dehydrogenase (short-subunit alcohol dehydrogenase family)